jgi:hypothetical protein
MAKISSPERHALSRAVAELNLFKDDAFFFAVSMGSALGAPASRRLGLTMLQKKQRTKWSSAGLTKKHRHSQI